ncbi:hypothetical protein CBM2587_A20018 [Cupriavidus taiwanensis]|uniref:Uncharacterized protein n=1 Tax=Cupriavidus taiwanensis TaxID=164546 RepID=A0A975WZF2_9BURK|nr:hypothetical protein CBM2587_A20018 [Cupriavidus taiwanensis]
MPAAGAACRADPPHRARRPARAARHAGGRQRYGSGRKRQRPAPAVAGLQRALVRAVRRRHRRRHPLRQAAAAAACLRQAGQAGQPRLALARPAPRPPLPIARPPGAGHRPRLIRDAARAAHPPSYAFRAEPAPFRPRPPRLSQACRAWPDAAAPAGPIATALLRAPCRRTVTPPVVTPSPLPHA